MNIRLIWLLASVVGLLLAGFALAVGQGSAAIVAALLALYCQNEEVELRPWLKY